MKPLQKSIRWFHAKETLQNQWLWNALAYTRTNPRVLYAKFEMKPFQTYLKWFHFKETLQHQCFQQPAFLSNQKSTGFLTKVWNETKNKLLHFKETFWKPMLFLKFLLYGQHLWGFLRAVWNETTIGWFHLKKQYETCFVLPTFKHSYKSIVFLMKEKGALIL